MVIQETNTTLLRSLTRSSISPQERPLILKTTIVLFWKFSINMVFMPCNAESSYYLHSYCLTWNGLDLCFFSNSFAMLASLFMFLKVLYYVNKSKEIFHHWLSMSIFIFHPPVWLFKMHGDLNIPKWLRMIGIYAISKIKLCLTCNPSPKISVTL